MPHQLVTIAFSHFCEKARWALDRHAVDYEEHATLPFIHMWAVARHTRGRGGRADRASSPLSTPFLRTVDGAFLHDSTDILKWVDTHFADGSLYPNNEVEALEREWGRQLGPDTRRIAYAWLLPTPALSIEMAERNVSRAQTRLYRALRPVMVRGLVSRMKITPERTARSLDRSRETADAVAARLSDGRPYLTGDTFTAADLTFASLMAPLVKPDTYGAWMPPVHAMPPEAREVIGEMRQHPAGEFVQRMFAEHRPQTR
ncbi:MAG: glutathione S-transferase family protein [Sandaracinaceae bacterium]